MVAYLEGTPRHSPTEREEFQEDSTHNSLVTASFEQVPPGRVV
jgi:hypothetical protein